MSTVEVDGGYYAIKGFLFQFDKTIIEILTNPNVEINFEQTQDINYENYVLQVKHKETQNFNNSKIKKPLVQLLSIFEKDETKKFCLYCYFKDKEPQTWNLDVDELDLILGNDKDKYDLLLRKRFVENFCVEFSDDFEDQFSTTLSHIMRCFDLQEIENAIIYHSIIRSKLMHMATEEKSKRVLKKSDLETFIKNAEHKIFYTSYNRYLGKEKYQQFIRKMYFIDKTANIDHLERLFIIDFDGNINLTNLIILINTISGKYFRLDKSPAPYICIKNCNKETVKKLKQDLLDSNVIFTDGTCFDGDKFRFDRLIQTPNIHNKIKVKFIDEDKLNLLKQLNIKEVYQFFLNDETKIETDYKHICIQIEETKQILKFFGR